MSRTVFIQRQNLLPQLTPKQTYAEVVNGGSSFLDQLNEMISQIQSLLIMQRQVMQCVFPHMWFTTQNQDKQNWAHPPG